LLFISNAVPRKNILIPGKTLTNYGKCGKKTKTPPVKPGGVMLNSPLTHFGKNRCG